MIVRSLGEPEWTRRASVREAFLANKHSLIPGSLVFTDGTYKHEGVSTTPPSASLYCERASYIDHAAVWLSYNVRMTTSGKAVIRGSGLKLSQDYADFRSKPSGILAIALVAI